MDVQINVRVRRTQAGSEMTVFVGRVELQVSGEWAGSTGGWRPVFGAAEASTFDTAAEATAFAEDFLQDADDWRVVVWGEP